MTGSRNKAKKSMEEQFEHISKKLSEMDDQFKELREDNSYLSKQLADITRDNKQIEKQLQEIQKDNKTLIGRVNEIEKDMQNKDIVINELEKKVTILEEKADEQEQYSKRDNILISGLTILKPFNRVVDSDEQQADGGVEPNVPESQDHWSSRDKDIMKANIVRFAAEKLKVELVTEDIMDVHTLPERDGKSKGICIVRFNNRTARDRFYQGRRELYDKTTKPKPQNPFRPDRIYLNEHLTQRNATLFRDARLLKKNELIKHAWTKNCRVLVRLLDGTVKQVKNNEFFKQFRVK